MPEGVLKNWALRPNSSIQRYKLIVNLPFFNHVIETLIILNPKNGESKKQPCNFAKSVIISAHAERSHSWPSALAWKASIPKGIAGSNPALSASGRPERSAFSFNSF